MIDVVVLTGAREMVEAFEREGVPLLVAYYR